jgi:hypothetical protein
METPGASAPSTSIRKSLRSRKGVNRFAPQVGPSLT